MSDKMKKKYGDIAKNTYHTKVKPFLKSEKFKKGLFAAAAFLSGCITVILLLDLIVMPIYLRSGKEIRVPTLTSMTFQEAQEIARKSNLGIITDAVDYHYSAPVNTISYQIPAPDAMVKPGRRIHVVISKGPQPILMPNVTGKSPRNAELILREAGLTVSARKFRSSSKYPDGMVIDQFPKSGTEIGDKTKVVVYISN